MAKEVRPLIDSSTRTFLLFFALTGLALVFVFQDLFLLSNYFGDQIHPNQDFCAKKIFRVLLNDTFMLLAIHAWFHDARINWIAWRLMLFDVLILLPVYLTLKLWIEGPGEISTPLLSQFHRVIVNPLIMALLIPGVYLQRLGGQLNNRKH